MQIEAVTHSGDSFFLFLGCAIALDKLTYLTA